MENKLYKVTMADNRSVFFVIAQHETAAVAEAEHAWDTWKYPVNNGKAIRVECIAESSKFPRPSCAVLLGAGL